MKHRSSQKGPDSYSMQTTGEKIRILHIITRLIPGGADENTIQTVRGLDKRHYKIDLVIGGQYDASFLAKARLSNVIIMPQLMRQPAPWSDIRAILALAQLIRRNRYHIVHTHTAKAGIIGRLASALCRIPVVVHTLHGSTFHSSLHPVTAAFYRFLERLAAHVTNQFVTVGDDLRDIYIRAGVGCPDRYVTIRSGFDLSRFLLEPVQIALKRRNIRAELGIPEEAFVIGSASRLEPRKGQNFFLQAAQHLSQHHDHVCFIIAGDGPSAKELRLLSQALKVDDRVWFLGHRFDIEDVISAMDVFVLTSLWEGLPQVLVQAAALGRPIVTFDIEGAKEVVQPGENGFVIAKGDVTALIKALEYLINDRPKATQMGESGRKYVTIDYDKEVMISQINALYQNLIQQKSRRTLKAASLKHRLRPFGS